MKKLYSLIFIALMVAIDQLFKLKAVTVLSQVEHVPFIPSIVDFTLVYNNGAAFNMLAGNQWFLIAFTAVALLLLCIYLFVSKKLSKIEYCSWILVLSGGIGNLIDRVLNRQVVDFIRFLFIDFPVFNFADICVTTGVALLVISLIFSGKEKKDNGNL